MIKFRNAAVAAATAVALSLTGTAVAHADTDVEIEGSSTTSSGLGKRTGAWTDGEDGAVIEADHQVIGTDLLGGAVSDENPEWAEHWMNLTRIGIVGSIVGAVIAGINWLKFEGILPR